MAASSRSATARDFWSAFLDLNKNYRGYDGKLFHNDLDMAKRLLRPFPLVPSAASSRVSSRMHRFVEGQQGSNGENYENGERKLGFEPGDEEKNHYQVMRRDKENENFVEKPDVSINSDVYGHVCHEGEEIGTLNVGFPCESSPCDTMKAQTIDFQNKVLIDSLEDSENLSSCPIPWFGSDIGVHVDGGQNTGEVWTKTEHVKKQTLGVRPDFSIDLADVTMSISLRAITSLLERKRRYKTDDLNVCGNVAVLCGSWTGVGTLNVHRSDFRGVYNYIDGTVLPTLSLGDGELVDLTQFLVEQHEAKCLPSPKVATDSVIAWCMTSPGFGIHLDWQVREKLSKLISTDSEDDTTPAWYELLLVVDEYRCADREFPLTELYHMDGKSGVKLVNFDFQ